MTLTYVNIGLFCNCLYLDFVCVILLLFFVLLWFWVWLKTETLTTVQILLLAKNNNKKMIVIKCNRLQWIDARKFVLHILIWSISQSMINTMIPLYFNAIVIICVSYYCMTTGNDWRHVWWNYTRQSCLGVSLWWM